MLYLDPASPTISSAKAIHHQYMRCYVNKKIGEPACSNTGCIICTSGMRPVSALKVSIKTFLLRDNNIDKILIGDPSTLQKTNIFFWNEMLPTMNLSKIYPYLIDFSAENLKKKSVNFQSKYKIINPFVKQLNSIFNYKWFNSNTNVIYSSYKLCQKLDRYTCTYCNRSYTSTVVTEAKKTVTRPTLDHWFPESKFPLLAISFYNLIPSCYSCNSSVKGAGIQLLNKYIHPYVDQTQSEDFEFDYGYTSLRGFRIFVNDTSNGKRQGFKAKNTIEAMYIDEVYNSNISELRDMITIQRNYSLGYIDKMQKMLRSKMSKEEVYRLLFGVIYDQNNFHKRPLSKFKKDILKKLGMLKEM